MSKYPQVERLFLSQFQHIPTQGQRKVISLLSDFLFDKDPYSTFILKGYAGTGKTSLVSAIIQSAPQLRIKTLLLAPTGRAAKVLSNYSQKTAYTIHKKIYHTVIDSFGIAHCERAENKHSYTLFIVDEASMIGTNPVEGDFQHNGSLLEDLIEYVQSGNHCRLLFIGDTAQLPPVGSSESPALNETYLQSLFNLNIYQYELTEVVRQKEESHILFNATNIREQIASLSPRDEVQLPLFNILPHTDLVNLPGSELLDTLEQEYSALGEENVVFITRSNKRANQFNQQIRSRILFRDDEISSGDHLMIVKNNYYWLDQDSPMSFIANGDIVEVLSLRNFQEMYGFHFADASIRFIDYPDQPDIDCKILLETLYSEFPSLSKEESNKLFQAVLADYADIPNKGERLNEVRKNPYFNALQIKFSYALTCHKTQGGQWPVVFIDPGFMTEDMLNIDYLRWIYTALTRSLGKVYLFNFQEKFFEHQKE